MSNKATSRSLDFTNVRESSGINPMRVEAGDYLATVRGVNERESKRTGEPMWEFVISLKDRPSATYAYYCVLNVEQLGEVRNLLIAAGVNGPKKKVKVDPNKVVGRDSAISLEDDEYEGKEKSTIAAVFSATELAPSEPSPEADDDDEEIDEELPDEEEEDEEPEPEPEKPKRTRKPRAKKEPEPKAEEDDEEEIDLDDLDLDLDDD